MCVCVCVCVYVSECVCLCICYFFSIRVLYVAPEWTLSRGLQCIDMRSIALQCLTSVDVRMVVFKCIRSHALSVYLSTLHQFIDLPFVYTALSDLRCSVTIKGCDTHKLYIPDVDVKGCVHPAMGVFISRPHTGWRSLPCLMLINHYCHHHRRCCHCHCRRRGSHHRHKSRDAILELQMN